MPAASSNAPINGRNTTPKAVLGLILGLSLTVLFSGCLAQRFTYTYPPSTDKKSRLESANKGTPVALVEVSGSSSDSSQDFVELKRDLARKFPKSFAARESHDGPPEAEKGIAGKGESAKADACSPNSGTGDPAQRETKSLEKNPVPPPENAYKLRFNSTWEGVDYIGSFALTMTLSCLTLGIIPTYMCMSDTITLYLYNDKGVWSKVEVRRNEHTLISFLPTPYLGCLFGFQVCSFTGVYPVTNHDILSDDAFSAALGDLTANIQKEPTPSLAEVLRTTQQSGYVPGSSGFTGTNMPSGHVSPTRTYVPVKPVQIYRPATNSWTPLR